MVTLAREFSPRRQKAAIGHHIYIDCAGPDAAALSKEYLPEIEARLLKPDVTIILRPQSITRFLKWEA